MSLFEIFAALITLTAGFAWVNERLLRMPTTIGVMVMALATSLVLIGIHALGVDLDRWAVELLGAIEFDDALLDGILSFLLFAGALHVDLDALRTHRVVIAVLATVGLAISTAIVGVALHFGLGWFGVELPFAYCLLFGALISPTDPVAVLAIFKKAGAPHDLETQVAGESLFNDGVAVVAFLAILAIATGAGEVSVAGTASLLAKEVIGGVAFGLVTGGLAYALLARVDQYHVEILVTLALVAGGYALAHALHVSAPIAIVVAGLLIGNHGRLLAMSERTRARLDDFWELIDEILNAMLFVLIGLEVLVLPVPFESPLLVIAVIALTIVARFVAIGLPMRATPIRRNLARGSVRLMTWAGLRGGISVAMALSLPAGHERDLIVGLTYAVVVFSVIVQGLTIGPMVRRLTATR